MSTAERFALARPRLLRLAYSELGDVGEAEDVVQEAWLRLARADAAAIENLDGWLTTVVARLALDRLRSARARRETYVGPWLPEPVLTGDASRPDLQVERSETVTLAFLVLLEALSPEERAEFLLKDVFEYEHAEIAEMLGLSPANSRQLLRRAKQRLVERRADRSPAASRS